jgi:tRNA uridine 5-carbamoylmethylation protein Kti12
MSKKAIIICGFPGVGKTTAANNRINILDAESSCFSWVWDTEAISEPKRNEAFPRNYIKYIVDNSKKYDVILASSHREVREMLLMEGMQYINIAPRRELKNEYLIRYLQRGSDINFIELLNEKWDSFIDNIEDDGAPVIWLDKGEYLADVLGALAR